MASRRYRKPHVFICRINIRPQPYHGISHHSTRFTAFAYIMVVLSYLIRSLSQRETGAGRTVARDAATQLSTQHRDRRHVN